MTELAIKEDQVGFAEDINGVEIRLDQGIAALRMEHFDMSDCIFNSVGRKTLDVL